jgi:hypothetical protein
MKYGIKAFSNLELTGTTWEGAVLHNESKRGFYCPGEPIACYGATGEQILATLRGSFAPNLRVESELEEDLGCILAVAIFFKILFYIVAMMKCYDGREVKGTSVQAASSGDCEVLPKEVKGDTSVQQDESDHVHEVPIEIEGDITGAKSLQSAESIGGAGTQLAGWAASIVSTEPGVSLCTGGRITL